MLGPAIAGAKFTRGHFDMGLSIEISGSFWGNDGPIFTTYLQEDRIWFHINFKIILSYIFVIVVVPQH